MQSKTPHTRSLAHHGYIRGLTISSATDTLCHYYGNLRYALPPSQRWRKAIPLPGSYSYGTHDEPADCQGVAGVCPQPGFGGPPDQSHWTEDCFQLNVYVPAQEPPERGWPVLFFIHGGWLQFGTPNAFNPAALISETPVQAIVVMPAYRLNVFGFLYGAELELDAAAANEAPGNHGFWDQRLALEWTRDYVGLFGGDSHNVTVAGYSAGAHSVFHQLAYDLRAPQSESIIKQACMWSNSPTVQPKSPTEAQPQFNALLDALQIPASLPASTKLARLRDVPAETLLHAALSIDMHQYRPTTETKTKTVTGSSSRDDRFIDPDLFRTIRNGTFAQACKSRGIRLLLGECRDEPALYSQWFPPKANTLLALRQRLYVEYPRKAVDAVLPLYTPTGALPAGCKDWNHDAFGRIYADMQVYMMQRGFIYSLFNHGGGDGGFPADMLFRYRVEMRLKCVDKIVPPEWGVTHSTDQSIWFWGNGDVDGPEEWEKEAILKAFIGPLGRFLRGLPLAEEWGARAPTQMRTLKPNGEVVIWEDALWDDAVTLWNVLRDASADADAVKL